MMRYCRSGFKLTNYYRSTRITAVDKLQLLHRLNGITAKHIGSFCSQKKSLIDSMSQVQQGYRFYDDRNIGSAVQYLQRSLSILPFYEGSKQYKQDFDYFIEKLIDCYVWRGDLIKVQKLILKAEKKFVKVPSIDKISEILSIVGLTQTQITNEKLKNIQFNYSQIKKKYSSLSDILIQKQLTKPSKHLEKNSQNISEWLHTDFRQSFIFLMTATLANQNFTSNPDFNKICNTLLKNTQRSSQKNVVKALTLIVTNLLRNDQFLQAQGILQYCLDRKRQNLKPQLLKTNQEYILLQLLLSRTFAGVNREEECRRLVEQYKCKFELDKLVVQNLLLDSI